MSVEGPQVGERVSYEDVANPRKYGEIVDVIGSAWGVQYVIRWDCRSGDTDCTADCGSCKGIRAYSDLRQAGWRREPAVVYCTWGTGQCRSAADVHVTTYAEDGEATGGRYGADRPLCFGHLSIYVRTTPEGWSLVIRPGAQQRVSA